MGEGGGGRGRGDSKRSVGVENEGGHYLPMPHMPCEERGAGALLLGKRVHSTCDMASERAGKH
jgi:hypothetical protein